MKYTHDMIIQVLMASMYLCVRMCVCVLVICWLHLHREIWMPEEQVTHAFNKTDDDENNEP